MDSGLLHKSGTNVEGEEFWKSHFKIKAVGKAFPLFFDLVSEEFRDKSFAVLTLTCLGLFCFYLAVFNKPESHLSCLSQASVTAGIDGFLNIDGVIFKVTYGVLAGWSMLGNIKRYPRWVVIGCGGWVLWACGCLIYDLTKCDMVSELSNTTSTRFLNFLGLLVANVLLAIFGVIGLIRSLRNQSREASVSLTSVRVKSALVLSFWILLNLFASVPATQTIQGVITLFQMIEVLDNEHFPAGSLSEQVRTFVQPFPYALLTGALLALGIGFLSLFSLYQNYGRVMRHILQTQGRSLLLREIWRVGAHNGMFFIGTCYSVQFVANSVYLYVMLLYFSATFAFLLYSEWVYQAIWTFLVMQPIWILLMVTPFLIKWFYFPRLIDAKSNRIRNHEYFAFWDLIQSVYGVVMALMRAFARLIVGISLLIGFGYRSDRSVFPAGWEGLDSLYTTFCGMVVIHCLDLGIRPEPDTDVLSECTAVSC